MEIEVSSSTRDTVDLDSIRVKRKTLQNLLDDCQRALELLNLADTSPTDRDKTETGGSKEDNSSLVSSSEREEEELLPSSDSGDPEADKLYDLIKSRVECDGFREKIELAQVSLLQDLAEEGGSWDVVSKDDLWGEGSLGQTEDDYVVVREEDIADGIACFMATYLSSLKQTKDISPDQLQKALSTMFSVKKRKGKLRKAWEGSKVIYNVASWSATAIGIYQNPMILSIASKAFWVSCKAISKLV
ncbi:RING finger protein [Hirschfeldia incana]|nr:RING finger protein [Hirschfeldia incana]